MPDPARTIPDFLLQHLVDREAERQNAPAEFYATLTDRERALVRDAAVMGYVQGTLHPRGEKHPKDSWVTALVVQECLAFPDLYPAINATQPA
ncbi:hypothetical protein ACFVFF_23110 [Streptomyces sp. NPDC057680]|uniref:hypothetical protein n=1 Tax=Streptomyces sp. NPDC057680 TaxID=3346208 RepID=UPI00368E8807